MASSTGDTPQTAVQVDDDASHGPAVE